MATSLQVEDNQNTEDFTRAFSNRQATTFAMPRAAWKARAARPDLVLRNFDLPDVNGCGIVLSLRRTACRSLP